MKVGIIILVVLLLIVIIGWVFWARMQKKADVEEQKRAEEATKTVSFNENSTVSLPTGAIIDKALYGTPTTNVDVTEVVKGLLNNATGSFIASNSTLGGDPVPNTAKVLTITYHLPATS